MVAAIDKVEEILFMCAIGMVIMEYQVCHVSTCW
jgi:hypothetical protein